MEFSKPIYEVEHELANEVRRIVKEAIRPEQCARLFAELDKTHPDIHELINRLPLATGNDRYYCMIATYMYLTKDTVPRSLYRSYCKSDSPEYSFSTEPLKRAERMEEAPRRHYCRR